MVERCRGLNRELKKLDTLRNFDNCADGQALGKNTIAATGEDTVAGLHVLVSHDLIDDQLSRRPPLQDPL